MRMQCSLGSTRIWSGIKREVSKNGGLSVTQPGLQRLFVPTNFARKAQKAEDLRLLSLRPPSACNKQSKPKPGDNGTSSFLSTS